MKQCIDMIRDDIAMGIELVQKPDQMENVGTISLSHSPDFLLPLIKWRMWVFIGERARAKKG